MILIDPRVQNGHGHALSIYSLCPERFGVYLICRDDCAVVRPIEARLCHVSHIIQVNSFYGIADGQSLDSRRTGIPCYALDQVIPVPNLQVSKIGHVLAFGDYDYRYLPLFSVVQKLLQCRINRWPGCARPIRRCRRRNC